MSDASAGAVASMDRILGRKRQPKPLQVDCNASTSARKAAGGWFLNVHPELTSRT